MTIAALITQGVGPGGTIPYLLTGGLDLGASPPPAPPEEPVSRGGLPPSKADYDRHKKRHKRLDEERYARFAAKRREVEELEREIRDAIYPHEELPVEPLFEQAAPVTTVTRPTDLAQPVFDTKALNDALAKLEKLRAELLDEEDVVLLLLHG